jgi:hypothetical protein
VELWDRISGSDRRGDVLPPDLLECSLGKARRDAHGGRGGRIIATTALFGALIVSLAVVLAVAGLALVQRLVPLPLRQANNTATGTIYAALYVMFGVTIGFSLFLVWQQYDAAQKMAESEAAQSPSSSTRSPSSTIFQRRHACGAGRFRAGAARYGWGLGEQ